MYNIQSPIYNHQRYADFLFFIGTPFDTLLVACWLRRLPPRYMFGPVSQHDQALIVSRFPVSRPHRVDMSQPSRNRLTGSRWTSKAKR
ncbi:hypothetical protein BJY04DRAFT_184235 [Aspergillus karnatakaensis]|uniref:uncharacterized protein n=1 Tax=Aspergillus karnatakaensis TaxID=1810916 RepID=UPI003CCD5BAD